MNGIDLLPLELKEKSLSLREVILPYKEAIKAIMFFEKCNWMVVDLIGLIKYSDYKNCHLGKYQVNLDKGNDETRYTLVKKSAYDCIRFIRKAHKDYLNMKILPESELYFCIIAHPLPALRNDMENYKEGKLYICFHSSLRIYGERIPSFEEITRTLGLIPTHTHRKGESRSITRPDRLWDYDMWIFDPPVDEEEHLNVHIQTLWSKLKPHKDYLLKLKEYLIVDVFLGYRTNFDEAGFVVAPESLEMFVELNIPFNVSVIVV